MEKKTIPKGTDRKEIVLRTANQDRKLDLFDKYGTLVLRGR